MVDHGVRRRDRTTRLRQTLLPLAALTLVAPLGAQEDAITAFVRRLDAVEAAESPAIEAIQGMALEFDRASNDGAFQKMATETLAGYVDRARRLMRAHTNADTNVWFEASVAWTWTRRGELASAIEALTGTEALGSEYESVRRGEMLAQLYLQQRDWQRAKQCLDELLSRTEEEQHGDRCVLHGLLVEAYSMAGKPDLAAKELQQQRVHAEKSGDRTYLERARITEIDYCLSNSRHARVLELAHSVLEPYTDRLRGPEAPEIVGSTLIRRAFAEFGLEVGDPSRTPRARQTLEHALSLRSTPIQARQRAHLKLLEIAVREEDVDRARTARDRYLELRPSERTERSPRFAALEARLRQLDGATPDDVSRSVAKLRDTVTRQLDALRSFATDRGPGAGHFHLDEHLWAAGELIELLLDLAPETGGPVAALDVVLDTHMLNGIARHRNVARCSVADIQREFVRPGCGILTYVPSRERTHLFVIERDDVTCVRLPARVELVAAVRPLVDALAVHPEEALRDPSIVDGWRTAASAARRAVLPDELLARVLRWKGITVTGADMLRNVPFEALMLPSERLLGEAVAVDQLASLPLGVALRRAHPDLPRETRPLRLSFFGCTDSEFAAPRVAFPRSESDAILEAYGDEANARYDADVVAASVLGSTTDITHVVAHGMRDFDRELGSGVALADGPLWPDAVHDGSAHGLVILSACSVGRATARRGDGTLATSLGGAFLRAGAHSVTLSRQPLALGTHLEFMTTFHDALGAGASPAAALREARAAHAGEGWLARFGHAQLQVFGLGQFPLGTGRRAASWSRELALALAGLVGIALGCWIVQRRVRG